MCHLKPLSRDAMPAARAKAERYRLLNEPAEAESICLDALHIAPADQDALVDLDLDRLGPGRAGADQGQRQCGCE